MAGDSFLHFKSVFKCLFEAFRLWNLNSIKTECQGLFLLILYLVKPKTGLSEIQGL